MHIKMCMLQFYALYTLQKQIQLKMKSYNPNDQLIGSSSKNSINTIRFFLNLRRFLLKHQLSLENFLMKINRKNINEINQVQFVKIINISETKFSAMEIYQVFQELKYGLIIPVNKFIENYRINDKNHPLDRMNEVQQQQKSSQASLSDAQSDVEKKIIRLGLLKLQKYVRENEPLQLFQECDNEKKDYLSKQQFNKFLIATDIKELNDKVVRQVLIKKLFSYYKDQKMGKQEFMSLFKINLETEKKKHQQKMRKAIMNNQPKQEEQIPAKIEDDNQNYAKQIFKKKLIFEKKEIEPKPQEFKPASQCQLSFKFTKSQSFEKEQVDILDAHTAFPRSYRLYRLGIPVPQEFPVFQQLQSYLEQNQQFIDHDNPKTNIGQYTPSHIIFGGRKFDIFQMAPSVLNREKSRIGLARQIQPKDIIQGQVGDCYLLSSIASIISIYPEVISEKFLFSANPAHFYAVKLFIDGQWKIFCTDDQFPCQNKRPVYAKPHGNQIWVLLIEKCWAKAYGSYQKIDSGTPTQGFRALTGAPTQYFMTENEQEQKQMYEKLKEVYEKRYVATASGSKRLTELSEKEQQKLGLIADHAYSFLKFLTIEGETVVKMRNPWGKTVWKGEWSFQSKKWTKPLRDKYNYHYQPDDGSFYMPWNLFMKYFSCFVICRIDPTNTHTSTQFISRKHKSTYFRVTIKQGGHYNFGVYQKSKRIFNSQGYEYSAVRITVAQQKNGDYIYVKSANKSTHGLFCQQRIQPGNYYVAIKVDWQERQIHPIIFTIYGTQKAIVEQIDNSISPFFKKGVVQSYARMHKGKIKYYDKLNIPQAYNEVNFSLNDGIGYIKIKNPTQRWFSSTYSLNKCNGLKIIKPNTLPHKFDMKAHSQEIIGFWVSCKGYSYQSSESMETKKW